MKFTTQYFLIIMFLTGSVYSLCTAVFFHPFDEIDWAEVVLKFVFFGGAMGIVYAVSLSDKFESYGVKSTSSEDINAHFNQNFTIYKPVEKIKALLDDLNAKKWSYHVSDNTVEIQTKSWFPWNIVGMRLELIPRNKYEVKCNLVVDDANSFSVFKTINAVKIVSELIGVLKQ